MPKTIANPPSFAEEWERTIRQLEEAGITTRDLEAAGIGKRSYQRHKNRPGGPIESKRTRELLAVLKPIAALKLKRAARAAQAKAERLKRILNEHGAGFVWGAVAIGTVAAVAGGWLCFSDDFGFALASGLGYSI